MAPPTNVQARNAQSNRTGQAAENAHKLYDHVGSLCSVELGTLRLCSHRTVVLVVNSKDSQSLRLVRSTAFGFALSYFMWWSMRRNGENWTKRATTSLVQTAGWVLIVVRSDVQHKTAKETRKINVTGCWQALGQAESNIWQHITSNTKDIEHSYPFCSDFLMASKCTPAHREGRWRLFADEGGHRWRTRNPLNLRYCFCRLLNATSRWPIHMHIILSAKE